MSRSRPCPTCPLPLIRGSLCCFFLLLLLVQTQSGLDWWRHCHGFGELRSGSAQVEAEFPAVTFITIIVMKRWLFSLFLWQSSAGAAVVCPSALISVISRSSYCMTSLLLFFLPLLIYLLFFFIHRMEMCKYNQTFSNDGSCSCRKVKRFLRSKEGYCQASKSMLEGGLAMRARCSPSAFHPALCVF